MRLISRKYGGFTLVEVLLVTIIIGIIFPLMISTYGSIIKANREFIARQNAIQQGYEFFEKINILMQDYTIDYEEYYNRQMVGCVNSGGLLTGQNFKRNIGTGGYCTEFTAYGNQNSTNRQNVVSGYHEVYECSSKENNRKDAAGRSLIIPSNLCGKVGDKQSYGQYKSLFTDVKDITDEGDSEDMGTTVGGGEISAIKDKDHIQELYLISHDGKSRLFFRRKLFTGNGIQFQYKIQILRLRGFDAGQKHNFGNINDNKGLYDRQIDTWACDTSMGFIGHGASVSGAYAEYYLPNDVDDCWVDLTYGNTNISSRNLSISPQGDSDLFWAKEDHQINPYMKIFIVNGVYFPLIAKGSTSSSILDFKIPLETTINMKDFYKE